MIYSRPVVPTFLGKSFKIEIQIPTPFEIQVSVYDGFGGGKSGRVAKYLFPFLITVSHLSFEESCLSYISVMWFE